MTVGCRSTKASSGLAASSMTAMAATTASIMTETCSTMPTEVMIESREKTASSTMIWIMTCQKPAGRGAAACSAICPSRRSCSSRVPLKSRNTPPAIRIRSRAEKARPPRLSRGSVRPMIQAMAERQTRRMSSARLRPVRKACRFCSAGSRAARMEMNTRLSTPRTTSSSTRVPRPVQAESSVTHEKSNIPAPKTYGRMPRPVRKKQKRGLTPPSVATPLAHARRAKRGMARSTLSIRRPTECA